jgi:DNA-binding protein YbaB
MFDKIQKGKQLLQLRQQAKQIQSELEKIEHTEEKGNIRIKVNGSGKVTYLEINGERREDLENIINKAMETVQKESAKKMMDMGGGLSGLLGGMGQ